MGKALFFDIDGTIWDEGQRIPDSTREAFRLMKERGHRLFISSGRTRVFIPDAPLMPLGFDGVLAGCGTFVEFCGQVKFYHRIEEGEIQRVNGFLKEIGAAYLCRPGAFPGRRFVCPGSVKGTGGKYGPCFWQRSQPGGQQILRKLPGRCGQAAGVGAVAEREVHGDPQGRQFCGSGAQRL